MYELAWRGAFAHWLIGSNCAFYWLSMACQTNRSGNRKRNRNSQITDLANRQASWPSLNGQINAKAANSNAKWKFFFFVGKHKKALKIDENSKNVHKLFKILNWVEERDREMGAQAARITKCWKAEQKALKWDFRNSMRKNTNKQTIKKPVQV